MSDEKPKKIERAVDGMNGYGAMLVAAMMVDECSDLKDELNGPNAHPEAVRLYLGVQLVYATVMRKIVRKLPRDPGLDYLRNSLPETRKLENKIRETYGLKLIGDDE